MFKLPNQPSTQAGIHELADFAELQAMVKGSSSIRNILAFLGRIDENDDNIGCEDNDNRNEAQLDDMMDEIDRRLRACSEGYPFIVEQNGTVLRHNREASSHKHDVYRYLLLSTRLNMQSSKKQAGIDGTQLLEWISAHILRNYLGEQRSSALVFGTAIGGTFPDKINELCRQLNEGGGFRTLDLGSVDANDDKLDVVAWVPFTDGLQCKLVIFCQCKTGTNWRDQVSQLQPDGFIKRWIREGFAIDPLRAFCISEAADRSQWRGICFYSGILFDRCRIVDFCTNLETDLYTKLKRWIDAALATELFS